MDEMLHCHHCDETIGVYEPLITLVEGQARETSRAAIEHPDELAAPCYHRSCFEMSHSLRASRGASRGAPEAEPAGKRST
ncbi:MAG: hypothetical protein ACYDHN_08320 [Solirubrobacteraceae bacterium]